MATLPGRARRCTALLAVLLAAAACSTRSPAAHPASPAASPPSGGTHADLVAAATARLRAQSAGFAAGDPARASSLSTGDAAADDQATARSLEGQQASGDTTDHGFDILTVAATPLSGGGPGLGPTGGPTGEPTGGPTGEPGGSDFLAYEQARAHADGGVFWQVELYHRDAATGPWRATTRAVLADNIDLPALRLDAQGNADLLSPAELAAASAKPGDIARSYAVAMNAGAQVGRLPADTFGPGRYTTGTILDAVQFLAGASDHGSGTARWSNSTGGPGVALRHGVLVFGSLTRTQTIQEAPAPNNQYFFQIQDPRRLTYGGLLAPGDYVAVTQTFTVRLAAVVSPSGLPDVVGLSTVITAVDGVPAVPPSP